MTATANPASLRRERVASWVAIAACPAIFLADVLTPRGAAICIAYIPLTLCGNYFSRPARVATLAAASTILTVLGGILEPPAALSVWAVVANRTLSILALWLTSYLVVRYRAAQDATLRTELSSFQREIEARKALLATIVESSDDAILSKSLDGTINSWNGGAERLFGYTAGEAIGKPVTMLIPAELHQEEAFILSELQRGRKTDHFETVRLHKNGRRIDVSLTISPLQDASGTVIGASKCVRDISAKKLAEAEAAEYTRALIRSNKALDDFAYAASHDLKAPLRVINNTAKCLEEDLAAHFNADMRENMKLLRGRVTRMGKLLDDLLDYSRIGRRLDAEFVESVPGDLLLDDVLALLAPPPGFVIDISPAFATLRVCRMPLQQILMNLIGNAIKHHHRQAGLIEVSVNTSAGQAPGMLAFSVKDDGPGIASQFHERIFNMFQTLKPRDQVEGSGMGLAMVHKYVEVFGGTVWIESAEGRGSTFHFTWPIEQPRVGHFVRPPRPHPNSETAKDNPSFPRVVNDTDI